MEEREKEMKARERKGRVDRERKGKEETGRGRRERGGEGPIQRIPKINEYVE